MGEGETQTQAPPVVKRQAGGSDMQPNIQGNIQEIARNVSLIIDRSSHTHDLIIRNPYNYYLCYNPYSLQCLIAVHNVAGSSASGSSAQSGVGHMLSMRRLLLLLLSSMWALWGEGVPLPFKSPDCQVSHCFHHHSLVGRISAVSFVS